MHMRRHWPERLYWVLVLAYDILVYLVFPIHIAYFVIFPIQYNIIQYFRKVDLRRVKYMRERLHEMRRKRKSIQRSEGEKKEMEKVRDKRRRRRFA